VFLSVRDMELRKVRFDASYAAGEIEFLEPKLWQAGPLKVEGSAELMGATQEIRVRGHVSVRMEAECDRCLETASFPLDADFDLFYRPDTEDGEGEEVEIDEGESEVGFYEGGGLELKDILREQVLLSLPMQRVCREACQGICPVCGQNRNQVQCGCQIRLADDRWAALKNLTK
jgi:uncharacterized protein